ncbi:MAG TPA: rhodanese-like domain-containing protein [Microlunatus sp.]|nr:rhodanese-like domain-containing protein [Microlunatus sp.]
MSTAAPADPGAVPIRPTWPVWSAPPAVRRPTRSIDDVLADARSRLVRVTAGQARQAHSARGAVLVDIRPAAQRAAEGELPEAVVIERNVLEWRFDPTCDARLSYAAYDLEVIVVCQEGYTSSLAAAALQELGIWRATDLIGGYAAWRDAGFARADQSAGFARVQSNQAETPITAKSPASR